MKQIKLLEGPDNVGKTTLSNKLVQLKDARYFHMSYSSEIDSYMYEYHLSSWVEILRSSIYHNVVMDRSIISALIYQHIYRGSIYDRPELLQLAQKIFDTIACSKNIEVILCLLPEGQWINQFKKSQELEGKQEMYKLDSKLIEVRNLYESLYTNKKIFGIPINFPIKLHDFLTSPINVNSL